MTTNSQGGPGGNDRPPSAMDATLCESDLSESPPSRDDRTEMTPEPSRDDRTEMSSEPEPSVVSSQYDRTLPPPPEPSNSLTEPGLNQTLMPPEEQEDGTVRAQSVDARTQSPQREVTNTPAHLLDRTLAPSVDEERPTVQAPARDAVQKPRPPQPPKSPGEHGFPAVAGYSVLKELGRGGMGVVYKAKQPGLNRLVALKMILGQAKGSKRERDLFRAEAEVIAKMQHPNIVQIFEIGEHDGAPFFSLEFVEGGCLADRIAKEVPEPRQSARIVRALAEGMDAAHSQGILHRDLKPANVLLGGKPDAPLDQLVPKITDFGLAKKIEENPTENRQSGGVMGTPSYMPPEQAEGRNWQLGPPADIYSLGAVLYDMLVGKPPFRGKTLVETLEMVVSTPPRPPCEFNAAIPRDLQVICLKCLEKEPANRYRSSRELSDDLGAFLNGEPIKARPYGSIERAKLWARRRPASAALVLLAFLTLVGMGVGGVVFAQQQTKLAREEESRRELAETREREAEEHARTEGELRQTAERERGRAEENFKEAKLAVQELTTLGQNRLSNVPHMEPVRRELLEKSLRFQERFLALNGDNPGQRHEVGRAHLRVGGIQEMLGRRRPAEKAYRDALASFTALAKETPKNVEYRLDLASTWNDLAILQQSKKELDEAEKSFSESLKIKKELLDESSKDRNVRLSLAESLNSRANLRLAAKPKDAEKDYREALKILADLPRAQCLETLGRTHNSLGAAIDAADRAAALKEYEASILCWKELQRQSPTEPRFKHELATAVANRARALHRLPGEDKKLAESEYKQASDILVELTSQYRGVLSHRLLLADVLFDRGVFLREQNRHPDSEKVWRDVLPVLRRLVDDLPEEVRLRQKLGQACNELAIALASQRQYDEVEALWQEAIVLGERLVKDHADNESYWQDLSDFRTSLAGLLSFLPVTKRTEPACRGLVDAQQRRVKALPKVAACVKDLAAAHLQLANLLVKTMRTEEACKELTQAIKHQRTVLASKPQPEDEQTYRDWSLGLIELRLQQEKPSDARAVLTDLLIVLPPDRAKKSRPAPEQAAGILVRCLVAAKKDAKLAEPDRAKAATACGDEAVKLLRLAGMQGWKDAAALETQPQWEPLRDRADFKALVADLKAKSK